MAEEKRGLHIFSDGYSDVSDQTFVFIIKDFIRQSIRNNRISCDADDIEGAVEVIYPVVFGIVFNSNFNMRHNERAVEELIDCLVRCLAENVVSNLCSHSDTFS